MRMCLRCENACETTRCIINQHIARKRNRAQRQINVCYCERCQPGKHYCPVSSHCVRCCNRRKGVCVCACVRVSVCEELHAVEILLDQSSYCLQPVTACHIHEAATNVFI